MTPHSRVGSFIQVQSLARAAAFAVVAILLSLVAPAASAETASGWRRWWLPANYSQHGDSFDLLFIVIFIVCSVVMLGVFAVMAYYLVRYRHRKDSKAHFTHGNKRLELIWTIIPAVLLLALAVWTKGSWDAYRYAPNRDDPNRAQILVIAEQFRWNVIYPGPDGKFGRYLMYPKTTDLKWQPLPPGDTDDFAALYKAPGPAFLPPDKAEKAINDYVSRNPLGKDFDDPAGKDDNWEKFPGREIYVPKGRLVDVHLTSKDVLHSFAVPEMRVKLDAVPGMRGHIYFTPTHSSAEIEKTTRQKIALSDLQNKVGGFSPPDYRIVIPEADAAKYTVKTTVTKKIRRAGKMVEVTEEESTSIASNGQQVTLAMLDELKKLNIAEVEVYIGKRWELVCQELCGNGHAAMQGTIIVLEPDEYKKRFETKPTETSAAQ